MRGVFDFLAFKQKIFFTKMMKNVENIWEKGPNRIAFTLFLSFLIKYADANKYVLCCSTLEKRKAIAK